MNPETVLDPPAETTEEPKPKPKKSGLKKAKEAAKATKKAATAKATEPKPNGKPAKTEPKPAAVATPKSTALDVASMRKAADILKQVADGTRLRVLLMLQNTSMHVGEMCSHLGSSQPAVSHHLALLRHGQIVECVREGKNNRYALTEKGAKLIAAIASVVGE